jgi:DNA-binding Lrp family transcriptional regulator
MSSSLNKSTTTHLSDIDKKLLQILLLPNGNIASSSLSKELGVPITTIRRRRRRLESEYLKVCYVLDIEKFGWRRVDFFISVKSGGKTNSVANKILEIDEVTYVGKSIGEHTIDLS